MTVTLTADITCGTVGVLTHSLNPRTNSDFSLILAGVLISSPRENKSDRAEV